MSNGYSSNLTIDRIDNNSNYEPCNCRWVTFKEQSRNKRSNHYVDYKGKTMTLTELSELSGIKSETLSGRIKSGMSVEEAVSKPVAKRRKYYLYNGEYLPLKEISILSGINYNTLQTQARRGKWEE